MKLSKSRGVFIVDSVGSPLWGAANARRSSYNCEILAATNFFSPLSLLKEIQSLKPDYLVFCWREAFDSVFSLHKTHKILSHMNPYVFLLIPDFISIHSFSQIEQDRVSNSDGIIFTCEKLKLEFEGLYRTHFSLVLYDLPDLKNIELANNLPIIKNKNQLIWIGNSKWGKRQGFIDHKGLKSLAYPVFDKIITKFPEFEFVVIDSSKKKISNLEVLCKIKSATCLIMTSNSEGTGLPILEAAAVGTAIVTTDVGIAPELLKGLELNQIAPGNVTLYAEFLKSTIENYVQVGNLMKNCWRDYLEIIQLNNMSLNLPSVKDGRWREGSRNFHIQKLFHWKIRWLLHFFARL
jgi:glycosyltransferase involved in cell wall biosynthesis